jgi:endogenous inhibitor of DNA gyrase (YacG/DUF329 family)
MPQVACKGCGKKIRHPPSRKITGFCARCLGTYHIMIKKQA